MSAAVTRTGVRLGVLGFWGGQGGEDGRRPERLEKKGVKILEWQYQSHKGYQKGFN